MSTFASMTIARLMATSCCMAMEIERERLPRVEVAEAEARRAPRAAAAWVARQLMPNGPRTSWPSMTFSPMLRFVQRLTSWYTVEMPALLRIARYRWKLALLARRR